VNNVKVNIRRLEKLETTVICSCCCCSDC